MRCCQEANRSHRDIVHKLRSLWQSFLHHTGCKYHLLGLTLCLKDMRRIVHWLLQNIYLLHMLHRCYYLVSVLQIRLGMDCMSCFYLRTFFRADSRSRTGRSLRTCLQDRGHTPLPLRCPR